MQLLEQVERLYANPHPHPHPNPNPTPTPNPTPNPNQVERLYAKAGSHGHVRVKSRVELAEVSAEQLGPLALPLRLPARLRSPEALAKAKAAAAKTARPVSLAAEQQGEPRKHYSQQQMQMGGFPPEAWERPQVKGDANQGNGGKAAATAAAT